MKLLISILLFINSIIIGQNILLEGQVIDSKTLQPLVSANIFIINSNVGTVANANGEFILNGNFEENDSLYIGFVGYSKIKLSVKDFNNSDKIIKLEYASYALSPIIISGIMAKEGITPASFSNIERKHIEEQYTIQDIPEYLSYLPSITSYSESGNGIGYNYISIRGFGQRRIAISVNGIPQNDPEDHNVYWLDFNDLLESTEIIQVQRGSGAGAIGYPAIGGSINIITSPFSDKLDINLTSSLGSYNTRKYSAKFSSGLIDKKYSIYFKISKTLSDGYRDNSWVDFNSYHVSVARYDNNLTTQINLYGGPISDGLAFYGLPKEFIKDKKLRRTNFVTSREIENFSQPHYELLNEISLGDNFKLNNAIFFVSGDGFFDYDGSWSIFYDDYFRLKMNGFDSSKIPGNALIRAEVSNKQWGVIPRLTWEHDRGTLVMGIEYRNHRSKHWGNIRFADNLPSNVSQDYQYYYYDGGKNILNYFINEDYNLSEKINVLGELQFAYHNYKLLNEKYLSNDISSDGLYINPRFGLNYKFNNSLNSYFSYSRVTREPRLKNYYDAAESSGGAIPQFEQDRFGNFDYDKPLVTPEIMNDFEVGARYANPEMVLNLNLYYMLFSDEIVNNGQLDRFGQPVTGNVDKSIHLGVELESIFKFSKIFELAINGAYSKNYISKGVTFINSSDVEGNDIVREISLVNNSISGFPDVTLNAIFSGNYKGFLFQLSGKYVGNYFSDNYDVNLENLLIQNPNFVYYKDNKVEPYFLTNFAGSYEFKMNPVFNSVKLFIQVNNIFNNLFAAHASGGDFFPAAERNYLTGIKVGI